MFKDTKYTGEQSTGKPQIKDINYRIFRIDFPFDITQTAQNEIIISVPTIPDGSLSPRMEQFMTSGLSDSDADAMMDDVESFLMQKYLQSHIIVKIQQTSGTRNQSFPLDKA